MRETKPKFVVGEPTQIEFHGDYLTAVFDGETVWVAVRPLIENLGLDWSKQYRKIIADPVLSQVVAQKATTSQGKDGKTYQVKMLCLPLEYINGLLFKINPSKIPNPQVREKVILYQKECYKALYNYFIADKVERAYSFEEFVKWAELEIKTIKAKSQGIAKAARLINAVVRATKDPVLQDKLTRKVLQEFGYKDVVEEAERENPKTIQRRLF
ncbi:P22_AR N-terminal domain-containing protein [Balnearium lithotrophicum]|uniref:P22_AR N-terminal domain-containing protein n=1 Tax=Balnearium lithotrophicum TaxID=223788 RepID=A0A521CNN6_9BACT|nr:phage antirepressor N-terminal domain-containing protein [Balnearium lithotrophicum]SMO61074.1 P22_AR N-terminal domain-containing protein [Balnearium lithotrophicum]